MSKPTILEIVPPAKAEGLVALANEINQTHASAKSHAQLAVVFAMRTGILCERAKEVIEHKLFGLWLEKSCPQISIRTAQKYMALVRAAKNETLSLLPPGAKADARSVFPEAELVAPGFLERVGKDVEFREGITAKVSEVVGEGSLTDLYKDYGVIHGPRNVDVETDKRIHYPAKAKKLTPEQIARQNRAAAKALFTRVAGDFKTALDDKQARRFLEPKDWIEVRRMMRDRMKQLDAIADKAEATAAKGGK